MKITDTYEWVFFDGEHVKLGITEKAQKEIGEIVHVHFPKIGDVFQQGSPILVLESTKSAIDTYAPISGEVIEINPLFAHTTDHLNTDPEGKGWILLIKPNAISQYHDLEEYSFQKKP